MRLKARNRIVTAALLLLVLLVVVGALLSGAPPVRAAEAFTLDGRQAPVGMATDHDRERYWLLERTSGRLQLTGLGADGTLQGRMESRDTLTNAQALAFVDGEAWVGDIGGRRQEVSVYRVTQPWPGTEILHAPRHRLTYPDGPHDAAAILVDGDHRIHIVTRGQGAGIYRAPADPSPAEPSGLERIADAPAEDVTDAVVLLDGRWVLRTPTTLITLDAASHATLGEAEIGVVEKGEAITQALTPGDVVTAAGPSGEVTSTTIPGPGPTASQAPRPPRPSAVPVIAEGSDPLRTHEQTGTTLALVAALVLAGLAAVFVLVRR